MRPGPSGPQLAANHLAHGLFPLAEPVDQRKQIRIATFRSMAPT